MMSPNAAQWILMYFILPVWLVAGFADYLCHRAASIQTTSGPKESLLHLAQFGEMAVPTLAAIFFEINALVFAIMLVSLVLHQLTAMWDVSYAYRTREVRPVEQHIHSVLEILPLAALLLIIVLHPDQFLSLFGIGADVADYTIRLKDPPLPWLYVSIMLTLVFLFEVLPYIEELVRGLRARKRDFEG
jgi:hypothetical protein